MRLAQEITAYLITLNQADKWNDLTMQFKASEGYRNNLNQLSNYYRGNLINMPNYNSHFKLSNIIRKVTPW